MSHASEGARDVGRAWSAVSRDLWIRPWRRLPVDVKVGPSEGGTPVQFRSSDAAIYATEPHGTYPARTRDSDGHGEEGRK